MKVESWSRLSIAAVLLGVVLMLPSLGIGHVLDDFIYLNTLEERIPGRSADAELFVFADEDSELTARYLENGGYPWWTEDDLHLAFFRPLSSLMMRVDHALFGGAALMYHVHSLLWWAGLLVVVAALFRRALPGWIGSAALLIFALDVSHALPAGWISNRNALVAALPALAGLLSHLSWRETGWRPGRWLGPVGFAVGLLGGEIALGVCGYFVAYEAFGRGGSGRERLAALAPILAVGVIYAAAYRALGYGTSGSGIYIDPVASPAAFLAAAPVRMAILLCGAIVGPPADLWLLAPPLRPGLVALGLLGVAVLGLALGLLRRSLALEARRSLRWLLAGSALSILPSLATFPADRLFLVASLGVCAALAVVLVEGWRAWSSCRGRTTRVVLRGVALYVAFLHLVVSPLHLLGSQAAMIVQRVNTDAVVREVELDTGVENLDAIVLSAPDFIVGMYAPLVRAGQDLPMPREWRLLSLAPHDHRVTRTGPRSLELEVLDGAMLTSLFEQLYREPEPPLRTGDVIRRGWLEVQIVDADERGPTVVAFRFDRELEDESLRFLHWKDGALRRFEMLAPGESALLPWTAGPLGF